MYRTFNIYDNCDKILEYKTVVCPFSTLLSLQMERWQLIDIENPDNKVRVVRNLYIWCLCEQDKFEVESVSQDALHVHDIGETLAKRFLGLQVIHIFCTYYFLFCTLGRF